MTNFKTPAVRDPDHLARVRAMPCLICARKPSDPAHVRLGGFGGTGLKPGDDHVVPLCRTHHEEQHRVGERTFWARAVQIQPDLVVRLLIGYSKNLYKEN
jgi:hypothetical protein